MRTNPLSGFNPSKSNVIDLNKEYTLHYVGGSDTYLLINALYVIYEISKFNAEYNLELDGEIILEKNQGDNEPQGRPEALIALAQFSAILNEVSTRMSPQASSESTNTSENLDTSLENHDDDTEQEPLSYAEYQNSDLEPALEPELVSPEDLMTSYNGANREQESVDVEYTSVPNNPRDSSGSRPKNNKGKSGFKNMGLFND